MRAPMPLEFFRRASGRPRRLAILPGTFNPPTLAHLALAGAALTAADEVLFVLPRIFPHKGYEGARFDERVRMLEVAIEEAPRFSIAACGGGLFIDIALAAREAYGPKPRLSLVCGRDAAEAHRGLGLRRPPGYSPHAGGFRPAGGRSRGRRISRRSTCGTA